MKRILTLLMLASMALAAAAQFITKPLSYPDDGKWYSNYWMSIVDANHLWIGTVKQNPSASYMAYSIAIKTTDGGDTWQFDSIPVPGSPLIQWVAAWDANICYYVISDNVSYGGSVWKTTDGGTTWAKKSTSLFLTGFANYMCLFSADTAVALGDPEGGFFEIELTNDGGNTWTRVQPSNIPPSQTGEWSMPDAYTRAGNTIWFCTSKGRLFKSADRGATWTVTTPQPGNNIWFVTFSDEMNGAMYSMNQLYTSADGGATWIQKAFYPGMTLGHISSVEGIPGTYVLAAYDQTMSLVTVFYSPDHMNSIVKIDSNIGNSTAFIYFKDAQTGWLSGGISKYDDIHKFVGSLTGVNSIGRGDKQLSVFPNPTNTDATVIFPSSLRDVDKKIMISDMSGRVISESFYGPGVSTIVLTASGLSSGVYILELSSGSSISNVRWLVCH